MPLELRLIQIDDALWHRFEHLCADAERSPADVLLDFIDEWCVEREWLLRDVTPSPPSRP